MTAAWPKTVTDVLELVRRLGVEVIAADGRIGLRGPAEARARLRPLVKQHKPELLALLTQAPAVPAPSMREAHDAYLAHHWRCPTCSAAGQGYGQRCAEGAQLWDAYNDAAKRERAEREAAKRQRPTYELPKLGLRLIGNNYVPANEQELARMLARVQRAERLGLSAREADALADRLHLRDRDRDDRHLCAECRALRADGNGWHCTALGQRIPTAWVTQQLQRCPDFREAEP